MAKETPQELVLEAGRIEAYYWRDIWRCRELFLFLTWRDVLVRYKQTVFGVAWAWFRPLLTMLAFTLVFGRLAKLPSDNLPYSVLVFIGLLPWQFFSTSFVAASSSMTDNANLISKVYFPRLIIPAAAIMVCLFDTLIAAVLLAALMMWFGVWPDIRIIAVPFFLILTFLLSLGSGLLIAALNVRYRDFRYVVPFLMQFGMYVSPVGFSSSIVPEKWRAFYSINPMVGIIDGFRWALGGTEAPLNVTSVAFSCIVTAAFLCWGIRYFRRTEQTFADVI